MLKRQALRKKKNQEKEERGEVSKPKSPTVFSIYNPRCKGKASKKQQKKQKKIWREKNDHYPIEVQCPKEGCSMKSKYRSSVTTHLKNVHKMLAEHKLRKTIDGF